MNDDLIKELEPDFPLEEGFEKLEELLLAMEGEEISIEESFALFERGTALIHVMHDRLASLEGKVEQITAEGALEAFDEARE